MADALTLAPPADPKAPELDPTFNAPSTTGKPVNRLELAKNAFNTFATSTAPQYQADLRLATQAAAGKGQIGSGGLRTNYGNLANTRALALDTKRDTLINDAITGSIEDQRYADSDANAKAGLGIQRLTLEQQGKQFDKSLAETVAGRQQQGSQFTASLALQKAGLTGLFEDGTKTFAQKQADVQKAIDERRLSVEEGSLALQKLAQAAALTGKNADGTDTFAAQQSAAQLQLQKDQLAQTGANFGLSLAQQKELATIADKTQNRQIDVSSAQGKNALLLELARIMGAKDSDIDENFLAAIAAALGIALPKTDNTTTPPPVGTGATNGDPTTEGG